MSDLAYQSELPTDKKENPSETRQNPQKIVLKFRKLVKEIKLKRFYKSSRVLIRSCPYKYFKIFRIESEPKSRMLECEKKCAGPKATADSLLFMPCLTHRRSWPVWYPKLLACNSSNVCIKVMGNLTIIKEYFTTISASWQGQITANSMYRVMILSWKWYQQHWTVRQISWHNGVRQRCSSSCINSWRWWWNWKWHVGGAQKTF